MLSTLPRRVAVGSAASGLVLAAVASGSVPAGAASGHTNVSAKSKPISAFLSAVSVVPGSSTTWAIGDHQDPALAPYALRRTGSHWTPVTVKAPTGATLRTVAAGSAKSIWSVGFVAGSKGEEPLIEHSTGGSFKPMKVKLGLGTLSAVAASSASNAWAIGATGTDQSLVLRWNGKKWSKEKVGSAKNAIIFTALSVSSPSNAWFLGGEGSAAAPIAAHWNGHSFKVQKLKVPLATTLEGISGPSASNAWIAGFVAVPVGASFRNEVFADHWNGKTWKRAKTPAPSYQATPASVAAFGSHAYIAGQGTLKKVAHGDVNTAFMLQLVGGHWKVAHIATPGKISSFNAVSESSKAAVAVGLYETTTSSLAPPHPLGESLHGTTWKQQATPE